VELNPIEVRVLGSLMEKEAATPGYYPLTLNALCAACNQKSNRDPVLSIDEGAVEAALETLRTRGLSREISGAGHRVHKFGHRMGEVYNFDRREQAVLCVLMLRGPQTAGELRGRTERLYRFDDLEAVQTILGRLADREPALVKQLSRRPGEKEPRYAHLLSGDVTEAEIIAEPAPKAKTDLEERVARLEAQLTELRQEFIQFRANFD